MTRDFTLSRYEALCKSLISSSYRSITVAEYIQGLAVESFVILRHDVDRRTEMAGAEGLFPTASIQTIEKHNTWIAVMAMRNL